MPCQSGSLPLISARRWGIGGKIRSPHALTVCKRDRDVTLGQRRGELRLDSERVAPLRAQLHGRMKMRTIPIARRALSHNLPLDHPNCPKPNLSPSLTGEAEVLALTKKNDALKEFPSRNGHHLGGDLQ